jgi:ergothioneine biosynthesis protein EgtB
MSSMGTTTTTARVEVSLLRRLAVARARTDELFALISRETLYERPIPGRRRFLFYLGHLEAFDWNLIGRQLCGLDPIDSIFDELFSCETSANGQSFGGQREDLPAPAQIAAYNRRAREAVDEQLEGLANPAADRPRASARLLQAAIEHRLMHAENLAYMLHQLPSDRKSPREGCPAPTARPGAPHMLEIPAGPATLGLPRGEDGPFGWDNEFEEHRVAVPAFQIDAYKVTNREFLHFLANGGYQERSLWGDAGWEWLRSSGTSHPAFWTLHGNRLFLRTMFGELPLPMDWPVYVSHAEASAYVRWAGKELPSEAEWHRAAYGVPDGPERPYPWGHQLPGASRGNFDFQRWDTTPVNAFPAGASAWGVEDLVGNGWEWTSTLFAPLPGFEPFSFHPGYSAGSFDKQNYILKGGSARTAACLLRRSFRNWGQPRDPFRYAGFRCVRR